MSKEKNDIVDIVKVVNRAKIAADIESDREFAVLLGISGADFSNRKRRGSLLPLIVDWAVNESVDIDFLVTGEHRQPAQLDPDPEIATLMEKARKVLTSGNPVTYDALERNINYFAHAVDAEIELQELKEDVKVIKAELARLKRENMRYSKEGEEQSSDKKVA